MLALIVIIHVVVCVALIMIVLLQTGKGADMGAAFGGGSSQTLFGASGASTFLSKATTVAAIVFMVTCLALAYMSGHQTGRTIMKDTKSPATQQTPNKTQQSEEKTSQPAEAPKSAETPKSTESAPVKPQ